MAPSTPEPVVAFVSYSRRDERHRARLEVGLATLRRQGLIADWYDRKIGAGTEWAGEIDARLNAARLILLLVSADFLASDYARDKEMARAMDRHDAGEARVIPIILRPCDWHSAAFGRLQALPRDGKPVTRWADRDEAWLDVVDGIRTALAALSAHPLAPPRPSIRTPRVEAGASDGDAGRFRTPRGPDQDYPGDRIQYLDFDLEIGPWQEQERAYSVAVRSPAGEARQVMGFPFSADQLRYRLASLEGALRHVGSPPRRRPTKEEHPVQEFGRTLFDALLAGETRSRFDTSRELARRERKGLRLKLRIAAPELAALPWEFLFDGRRGDFLALSRHTPVVRSLDLPRAPERLTVQGPLRVLGMVAGPSDLPSLDTERERGLLEESVRDLVAAKRLELAWLEGGTWRDLQRALRPVAGRGPWHVFHFIGHGGFDPETQEGLLALATEGGRTHRLSATQLGRLLSDHAELRLALLNACEGARLGGDVFSGTAAALVRAGLSAVLAMQYAISDAAAIELARSFYGAIADGLPVDAAVSDARVAMSLALAGSSEWGTPVLYLRSTDGVLFRRT